PGRRRLGGAQHGAGALHARRGPRFLELERRQPGVRSMRNVIRTLLILAAAIACGQVAAAAEYPDHPVRLIVPQAAGSATDTVARILGAALGNELGQQVVVDNRPGGALTLGLDLTAKSEPDGYTICMGPI